MGLKARLAPALIASLALVACGSSSSSSNTAATGSVETQATASTTSIPSTSPSTQTTASTPASSTRCTAAKLALSFLGQQGATGHGVLGFALKNTSPSSCRTFGYPGVQFLNASGHALPTVSTRTTHDFAGAAPLAALTVAPGASASFRLVVTHFQPSGSASGCTNAAALAVIPPNDTASLRVTVPGGVYECGRTTVTPLQPGTSAYRQ